MVVFGEFELARVEGSQFLWFFYGVLRLHSDQKTIRIA